MMRFLVGVMLAGVCWTQPVVVDGSFQSMRLDDVITYHVDTTERHTVETIDKETDFKPLARYASVGYSPHPHWVKVAIDNRLNDRIYLFDGGIWGYFRCLS